MIHTDFNNYAKKYYFLYVNDFMFQDLEYIFQDLEYIFQDLKYRKAKLRKKKFWLAVYTTTSQNYDILCFFER